MLVYELALTVLPQLFAITNVDAATVLMDARKPDDTIEVSVVQDKYMYWPVERYVVRAGEPVRVAMRLDEEEEPS